LIMAMLRKSPAERPSMKDVADALADFDHAPASISKPVEKLSAAEQRVVSVIVAGRPGRLDESDTLKTEVGTVDVATLRRIAERFGAEATMLPSGTAVVLL